MTDGHEAKKLKTAGTVRVIQHVPDEDLPALYSSAKAFVTASLYEGFCLPVAEAEACGCPVIASDRGAIPEIASAKAKLIPPTVKDFMAAMKNPPKSVGSIRMWEWVG